MSPDMMLIYSIMAQGSPALFAATRLGIRPEHLFDQAIPVFKLCLDFVAKGRLPSREEIKLTTGVDLDPTIDGTKFDPDLVGGEIVKRALKKELSQKLDKVLDALATDPFEARRQLAEAARDAGWSYGNLPTLPEAATVSSIRNLYLEAEAKSRKSGLLGYGSPWPSMDAASRGLQPGELTVVLAKRKLGKTYCKLAWANHIWSKEMDLDDRMLFLSMEMQPRAVYRRFAAVHLKLDMELFRAGMLTSFERERFLKWCDELERGELKMPKLTVISSREAPTVNDLGLIIAQVKPKIVWVDSFYMLKRRGVDSIWEKTLGNVEDIKLQIANEFDVATVISSQLKGTVSRDTVKADSDDAAYAKALGDYADAVRGLFATEEHVRDNRRIWNGMESREFRPVDLLINFNLSTMDFSEIQVLDGTENDAAEDKEEEEKPKRGKRQRAADNSDAADERIFSI